jgi:hypothetical protein
VALASAPVDDSVAIVVWVDHWHALVARSEHGQRALVRVDRESEPEAAWLGRVAVAAHDGTRLIVLGPDDERLAFDRKYEATCPRHDLFVEIEACGTPSPSELFDRLRVLEGHRLDTPD